jgi:hypothetical protein
MIGTDPLFLILVLVPCLLLGASLVGLLARD